MNSYHAILSDFDDTGSNLNDTLISMSNEAEKSKALFYEAHNKLKEKNSKIEALELKIMSIMCDRDSICMDNRILIYCNTL